MAIEEREHSEPSHRGRPRPSRRGLVVFLGGAATAIAAVSGVVGIVAAVQAFAAPRYADASNLRITSSVLPEYSGTWIIPPGTRLPTDYQEGLCETHALADLARAAAFDDPTVSVSITNDFSGGSSGALELDGLHARIVRSTPRTSATTAEFCPSAGESAEPWLTADLDRTTDLANIDPATGGPDRSVGPPTITLDPGETVTFRVTLSAEQRSDVVDLAGTLRNGAGRHSDVDLTPRAPVEVVGDGGVGMQITPASSAPHDYSCTAPNSGRSFPCTLARAPTAAEARAIEDAAGS